MCCVYKMKHRQDGEEGNQCIRKELLLSLGHHANKPETLGHVETKWRHLRLPLNLILKMPQQSSNKIRASLKIVRKDFLQYLKMAKRKFLLIRFLH